SPSSCGTASRRTGPVRRLRRGRSATSAPPARSSGSTRWPGSPAASSPTASSATGRRRRGRPSATPSAARLCNKLLRGRRWGSGRAAYDELDRELLRVGAEPLAGERSEQQLRAAPSALVERLPHGGEPGVGRNLDVVEADDGELLGHAQPERAGRFEHAE